MDGHNVAIGPYFTAEGYQFPMGESLAASNQPKGAGPGGHCSQGGIPYGLLSYQWGLSYACLIPQ